MKFKELTASRFDHLGFIVEEYTYLKRILHLWSDINHFSSLSDDFSGTTGIGWENVLLASCVILGNPHLMS